MCWWKSSIYTEENKIRKLEDGNAKERVIETKI